MNQIQNANTAQAVFDSFCDNVAPFGFTFISMGRLLPPLEGAQSAKNIPRQFHLSRGGEDLIEELVTTGDLMTKSPLVLHGFRVSVPFRWREAFQVLSEEQKIHVKRSQSHGLKFGICFPILQVRSAPGLMSMGRDTDFNLSLQELVALEVLVRKAFERMHELTEMPEDLGYLSITEREREVLYLVARGKTNWEIGAILNISEYSVRDHLKSVSKRMATSNRTHTVTTAIRMGLILP
ncbi:LuxR family transcriptional regulator [Litorimonas taeanensis]|nr:LuxR family transcriptional regulator [Litorimonas taeanensis]